ncbi:hypothetical protein [Morganella sp. EGD-HP17]|uniref:hypothetical protein n=1 Tax=Morganella sp. EGD-HP17 TaxID=1435146 RepID=UPI0004474370|nr:hypothetical protein [Morganella sp. EGD-HP17]ETO41182.1 hypothetical protein X965_12960 [Morganella sp. EGD-HP17]
MTEDGKEHYIQIMSIIGKGVSNLLMIKDVILREDLIIELKQLKKEEVNPKIKPFFRDAIRIVRE